jgi:hypothetical protein
LGGVAAKRRADARARTAVVPFPGGSLRDGVARFAPSGRSLMVGFALLALGLGTYAAARESSVFAIRRIELAGAPPPVAAQIRNAVDALRGNSLVALDGSELLRRVDDVPMVSTAVYDRDFPHTLRIVVRPEEPVAVVRRATESWLVSARGRVLERLRRRTRLELPRIWVPAATHVELGAVLPTGGGREAAHALAPLVRAPLPVRIEWVAFRHRELVFQFVSGVELRLGRPDDLRLKLAIARRIVTVLPAATRFLDVSVPERPVAGADSQVSG